MVVAPIMNYSFHPIFLQFEGSTSLRYTTARHAVLEVVRQLAAYGPKRFYIINQGITTNYPLAEVKKTLSRQGILLVYSDFSSPDYQALESSIRTIQKGTHADKIETSSLLYVAPDRINMALAADVSSAALGRLSITKEPHPWGMYSASGIYGFGKLGTKEKGEAFMHGSAAIMTRQIDSLRKAALPQITDRSADWNRLAGDYGNEKGVILSIRPSKTYLDYSWMGQDHSDFYQLHPYTDYHFASQLLDVVFVLVNGAVSKVVATYRGTPYLLEKKN